MPSSLSFDENDKLEVACVQYGLDQLRAELSGTRIKGQEIAVNKKTTQYAGRVIEELRLINSKWPKADLSQTNLERAIVRNSDISQGRWVGAELSGSSFNNVKALDSNWLELNAADSKMESVDWSHSCLADCCFRSTKLTGCNMDDCLLAGVKFMLAELDRCSLVRADLQSSEVMGGSMISCILSEVDLSRC